MTTAIQTIGEYEVQKPLGQGAGSQIFKVRRKSDQVTYALKVVLVRSKDDRKYYDQCQHEYEVGSKLQHPNLVKVYCFETTRKFLMLSGCRLLLEFIDGLPLAECMDLPLPRLLTILAKAADGLAYMHQKGYSHADIKPENIMITPAADVKIIDFGLVWTKGDHKDRVQGTLEYLAPEQATKKIVNPKTDIYNFGATMYRVFAGRPAPQMKELKGVGKIDRFVRPIANTRADFPRELDDLVQHCIKYAPNDRPDSMYEIRDQLRDLSKKQWDA